MENLKFVRINNNPTVHVVLENSNLPTQPICNQRMPRLARSKYYITENKQISCKKCLKKLEELNNEKME